MTIKEAVDIFYRLYGEHTGSTDAVGLDDFEISRFINTAQYLELSGQVYNPHAKRGVGGEPLFAYEDTTHSSERWHVLVHRVLVSSDAQGKVFYSALQALMPTETIRMFDQDLAVPSVVTVETRNIPVYKICNVARLGRMCRFVRTNDWWAQKRNIYTVDSADYPWETRYNDHILVQPAGVVSITLDVMRYPRHVWYDRASPTNNIDPELPDMTMHDVLLRAVQLASAAVGRQLYGIVQSERIEM